MAILQVPVTKAKATVTIDSDAVPEDVFKEALLLGFKELVNRTMTKITKSAYPDEAELKAKAMEQAEKNVEAINTGKIRFSSGKASTKASGVVMTEARRLAKNVIKDELKKAGYKIAHLDASEITKMANALLASEQGEKFVEQAKEEIAKREAIKSGVEAEAPSTIADIMAMVKINPDKKAKAEAAAEKRKAKAKPKAEGQLSAAQAKRVAPRAKPQAQTQA